jgi:hypothetical protein
MAPRPLGDKNWPRIRHDYEHSGKDTHEICAEHGISSSTLQNRVRQWDWTRRRPPVPAEGPAGLPQTRAAPPAPEPATHLEPPPPAVPVDARQIAQRLQGAITRVLAAIDAALAGLSASSHPRDIDRAGRAVAALTRTLHELNALKEQSPSFDPANDRGPDDPDEFAKLLLKRLEQFKAQRAISAAPNPPA